MSISKKTTKKKTATRKTAPRKTTKRKGPSRPTNIHDTMSALAAPFPMADIQWKIEIDEVNQEVGRAIPYLKRAAIVERLNTILGPDNWSGEPVEWPSRPDALVYKLTLHLPGGKSVTQHDGAEETEFFSFKGGITDAFKRTAALFGVGLYLQKLPRMEVNIQDGYATELPILPDYAMTEEDKNLFSSLKGEGTDQTFDPKLFGDIPPQVSPSVWLKEKNKAQSNNKSNNNQNKKPLNAPAKETKFKGAPPQEGYVDAYKDSLKRETITPSKVETEEKPTEATTPAKTDPAPPPPVQGDEKKELRTILDGYANDMMTYESALTEIGSKIQSESVKKFAMSRLNKLKNSKNKK